jgi:hypothetical protein
MQYWEVIADKLSAAGWSWGYCSAVTEMAGVGSWMPHRRGRLQIADPIVRLGKLEVATK